MGEFKDLTGQRFGRLTVIELAIIKGENTFWKCKCDCGKCCIVTRRNLKSGNTKSCGCLHAERRIEANTTHSKSKTPLYMKWKGMRNRCFNPNRPRFERYGGRGITVCDEWREDFTAFFDYVSKLEHFGEDGYSLDRINNDGNYEPGNVRWATPTEQARNKRTTVFVEYEGETISLQEAAEHLGISYVALKGRWAAGIRGDELFKVPRKPLAKIEYNGEEMTLKDATKLSGISYSTLFGRYKKGNRGAELFKRK